MKARVCGSIVVVCRWFARDSDDDEAESGDGNSPEIQLPHEPRW